MERISIKQELETLRNTSVEEDEDEKEEIWHKLIIRYNPNKDSNLSHVNNIVILFTNLSKNFVKKLYKFYCKKITKLIIFKVINFSFLQGG